jgi:hypothetical protein
MCSGLRASACWWRALTAWSRGRQEAANSSTLLPLPWTPRTTTRLFVPEGALQTLCRLILALAPRMHAAFATKLSRTALLNTTAGALAFVDAGLLPQKMFWAIYTARHPPQPLQQPCPATLLRRSTLEACKWQPTTPHTSSENVVSVCER